jgi:hypothetical protein
MEVVGGLLKKPGYPTKKPHRPNVSVPSKKIKWFRLFSSNHKFILNPVCDSASRKTYIEG